MRPQEINPGKLPFLFDRQLCHCKVKPGETIAVLADLETPQVFIQAALAAAEVQGAHAYTLLVNTVFSTTHSGDETVQVTKGTLELLEKADLILVFHVVLGTQWLGKVLKAKARVLMILGTPYELERMMPVPGLKEALLYTKDRLEKARALRVVSAAGTDFQCELGQSVTSCQYGAADEPGRVDTWGAGHVATYANPGSANGTIVVQPGDCWIFPYVRYVEAPLTLTIRDGIIVSVDGMADAVLMRQFMELSKEGSEDDRPYHVSHLGWGLHPNAIFDQIAVHGNEIKRIASVGRCWPGAFLFSTGPNAILPQFHHLGKVNDTHAHIDFPMFGCTVFIDDERVIEDGRIVDERMRVAATYSSALSP